MLAICTSFGEEYSLIQNLLKYRHDSTGRALRGCHGLIQDVPVDLIKIGVGQKAVELFATFDWTEYRGILLLGYCGGLVPELSVGDLVVARRCVSSKHDILELESQHLVLKTQSQIHHASIVTIDHVARQYQEKLKLGHEFQAQAVDMEAYYMARLARDRGIDLLVMKAVADGLNDEVPDFGAEVTRESIKSANTKDPRQVGEWRANMIKARESLKVATEQSIPALYQLWNF